MEPFVRHSEKVAINQLFFPYPLILSVPIDTCMPDHTACFSWQCDSNPACEILSPDQLPLPQRLLKYCAVAQLANTFPWSCHVKCLLPWAAIQSCETENLLCTTPEGVQAWKHERQQVTLKKDPEAGIRTIHWNWADSPELRRAEPLWCYSSWLAREGRWVSQLSDLQSFYNLPFWLLPSLLF